jgi:hypothetical protein
MTRSLRCDVCGSGYTGNGRTSKAVRHYRLLRYEPVPSGATGHDPKRPGRGKEVGAGSLDLCDDCWDRMAKPQAMPQRSHRRWANQHGSGAA